MQYTSLQISLKNPLGRTIPSLFANDSELAAVLFAGFALQFGVDTPALRVSSQWATEEKNVGLGAIERKKVFYQMYVHDLEERK
jgi:hypothetical protein